MEVIAVKDCPADLQIKWEYTSRKRALEEAIKMAPNEWSKRLFERNLQRLDRLFKIGYYESPVVKAPPPREIEGATRYSG